MKCHSCVQHVYYGVFLDKWFCFSILSCQQGILDIAAAQLGANDNVSDSLGREQTFPVLRKVISICGSSLFSFHSCSVNHKMLYASVKVGYNATHKLHTSYWDTLHPLFPDQTIFYFHMSIVNHFRNKIVSVRRNVHIT